MGVAEPRPKACFARDIFDRTDRAIEVSRDLGWAPPSGVGKDKNGLVIWAPWYLVGPFVADVVRGAAAIGASSVLPAI